MSTIEFEKNNEEITEVLRFSPVRIDLDGRIHFRDYETCEMIVVGHCDPDFPVRIDLDGRIHFRDYETGELRTTPGAEELEAFVNSLTK